MKLNLRNIELNDDYEVTTDNTILNMMDGTDMYSYIKHVVNPNLSQLTDLRGNKQVWLSMERHTERYKKYVSEYNPILWDIEEIEFEYIHDYYVGAHLVIGKEMFRAGKFGSGNNLLDHYLK